MTRGSIFLVCDKLIIESIEFNGDMGMSWHGLTVIRFLEELETANEFLLEIEKFNRENHNYKCIDSLTFPRKRSIYMKVENTILMTDTNYFKKFGSDWTFWKNISDTPVTIRTKDKKHIVLTPMEQVAINWGEYANHYKSSVECQQQIELENSKLKLVA